MVASEAEQGRGRSDEVWSVAGAGVTGTAVTKCWVASVLMSKEGDWWYMSREEGGLFESDGGDRPRRATGVEEATGAGRPAEMIASRCFTFSSSSTVRLSKWSARCALFSRYTNLCMMSAIVTSPRGGAAACGGGGGAAAARTGGGGGAAAAARTGSGAWTAGGGAGAAARTGGGAWTTGGAGGGGARAAIALSTAAKRLSVRPRLRSSMLMTVCTKEQQTSSQ